MSAYVLGTSGDASQNDIAKAIEAAPWVLLWNAWDPTEQQLYEALYAVGSNKPIVAAWDADSSQRPIRWMASRAAVHHIGHVDLDEALVLGTAIMQHACGERIRMAFGRLLLELLQKAESPVEERLAVHLVSTLDCECVLESQVRIETTGATYRADFLAFHDPSEVNEYGARPEKLIIEADGHDFHERTKEQARRDKSRDRALVAAGYTVMRFTGSEVWNQPARCAAEVSEFMRGVP